MPHDVYIPAINLLFDISEGISYLIIAVGLLSIITALRMCVHDKSGAWLLF